MKLLVEDLHIVTIFQRHLQRQNARLSEIYGAESSSQFRASNMCHIMLVYMVITGALCAFAVLYDLTQFTPKRLFYMGFLGAMFAMLAGLYVLTLKGHFRKARFIYLAVNTVFVFPAVLLTGGIPASATLIMIPLPLLYAFCLYEGKKALFYTVGYVVALLGVIAISLLFDSQLPDYSQNETSPIRHTVTFLILIAMLSFTLISLQYENRRAVKKARDAAAAKSDFLANMSHEIRTPMNGVLGLTDILMTKPMPPDQKELLRIVQSSGQSLLTIINDILDFSKLDAGQIELDPVPFNLKSVLYDVRDLMDAQVRDKGLYLNVDYDAGCPEGFIGDDGRLRQVFLNVIGNAIKFTKEGGVTVSVHLEPNQHVNIDIRDTGIGIAPEKLEHIFDQFTQADNSTSRRFGGTGLGLSISRKLVDVMGGHISATSKLGEGATFSVSLPLPVDPSVTVVDIDMVEPAVTTEIDNTPLAHPQPLLFLSRTPTFLYQVRETLEVRDFSCIECPSVSDMKAYLIQEGGKSPVPPIIILDWARDLVEFLPYARKLKASEGGGALKFVLCLKTEDTGEMLMSRDISVVNPPHDKTSLLEAINKLRSEDNCLEASGAFGETFSL